MTVFFGVLLAYFAVTSVLIVRWRRTAPPYTVPVALILAFGLSLFPFVRSLLSVDGRGAFRWNSAVMGWEWLLVVVALLPVHGICLMVIRNARKTRA